MITKLSLWYVFLQWQVFFFTEDYNQTIDMYRSCSFDNGLCDPLSKNWQLMLNDLKAASPEVTWTLSNMRYVHALQSAVLWFKAL